MLLARLDGGSVHGRFEVVDSDDPMLLLLRFRSPSVDDRARHPLCWLYLVFVMCINLSQPFTPIPSAVLLIHLLAGRYSLTTSSAAMGLAAGRAGHVARNTWPWVVPRDE